MIYRSFPRSALPRTSCEPVRTATGRWVLVRRVVCFVEHGAVEVIRRVPFAGALNFRDIGGYPVLSGGQTRWGAVYRSDSQHVLTQDDLPVFDALGVRAIYDLRRAGELAALPQASLRSGKIESISAESASRTLADGLRSQSIGPINFEHIRRYVDEIITVQEVEIRQAMSQLLFAARILAEPSGAVTTAAALLHAAEIPASDKTVAVVSGGNVEPQLFSDILIDKM